MSLSRRQFLLRGTAATLASGLATVGYTWKIEPFWVAWVHRRLPIKNLPNHLVGETLVQVSDLHIGPLVDSDYLIRSLKAVKKIAPGYVVYTGDFVSYRDSRELAEMKRVMVHAPTGRLGTAAILGNHDWGHGWRDWTVAQAVASQLEAVDIPVLRNQTLTQNGLSIIGVDDFWSPNYSLEAAFSDFDPDHASLVLCHNPDALDQPGWSGYQGWILSGHTHGGQCRPPFLPPPILPVQNKRYSAGHIPLADGRDLYINRGLGYVMQVRFFARPEVTVFTLERA